MKVMKLTKVLTFLTGIFGALCVAANHSEMNNIGRYKHSQHHHHQNADKDFIHNRQSHHHHHHRHRQHRLQHAQRRDNLGFLKTFTEENLHYNKLFKEKLEAHRHLKEKNFIGSTRAEVAKRGPILWERYDTADDDDNVYDEDEMAEIKEKEKKFISSPEIRVHHIKDFEDDERNFDDGIKSNDKRKLKQKSVQKIHSKTGNEISNDDFETSTSGEEPVKLESRKLTPLKKKSVLQHKTQPGVRKHSMSTHSSSPMKNLARIPILPIIPLPLLYSSGDRETSATSGAEDIKSNIEVGDQGTGESGNEYHLKGRKKENQVSGDWVDKLLAADQESNGFDEDDDFDEEAEENKKLGKNSTTSNVQRNPTYQEPINAFPLQQQLVNQQIPNVQKQQPHLQQSVTESNSQYQQVSQFNGENRFSNRNDNFGKTISGTTNRLAGDDQSSLGRFNNNKNNVSFENNKNDLNGYLASNQIAPSYTQSSLQLEQPFVSPPLLSSNIVPPQMTGNIVTPQLPNNIALPQLSNNIGVAQLPNSIASPQMSGEIASPQMSSNNVLPQLPKESLSNTFVNNQPNSNQEASLSQPNSQQYLYTSSNTIQQPFKEASGVSAGPLPFTGAVQLNTNSPQTFQQKDEQITDKSTFIQTNVPIMSNQANSYPISLGETKTVSDNNVWQSYNMIPFGNSSTIENVYIIPQGNTISNDAIPQTSLQGYSNNRIATSGGINNNNGGQNGYSPVINSVDQNLCASSCPSHCAPSCDQVCCTKNTIATDQKSLLPSIKYPSPKPLFSPEQRNVHSLPIGATSVLPNDDTTISDAKSLNSKQGEIKDWYKNPQNENLMFVNAAQNQPYSPFSPPINRVDKQVPQFINSIPQVATASTFNSNINNEYERNHALQNSEVNRQISLAPYNSQYQAEPANMMNQQFPNNLILNQPPTSLESFFPASVEKKTTFSLQPMKQFFLKVPSLSVVHLRKETGNTNANSVKYPNPACFKGCKASCLPHCSNYCCGVASKRDSIASTKRGKVETRLKNSTKKTKISQN